MNWENPFPGIDPYIESSGLWPSFHSGFIAAIARQLNAILPDTYASLVDVEIQLKTQETEERRWARPDVAVTLEPSRASSERQTLVGGVATLEPEVIGLAVEDPEEVTEKWVEIRSLDDDSIVTWIEVLSPRNKRGTGRQRYLAKRASLIERPVHIVEVDLLLCGRPLPMQRSLPEQRLYAFVSRAERRPQSEVYSWDLRDRLPAVPVPLRQPDPDVLLDLAAAYNSAYKDGRWTHFLRRQGQLEPQLSQADLEWGRTILGTGGETGTR